MWYPILHPCSFAPLGLCYPKLPTLRLTGSPWDKPLRPGIHRHLRSPPGHAPPRLAQPYRSSVSLGCAPKPCTISALPTTPPKPAQRCTIFILQGCAPKVCQARDQHTDYLHSAWPHPPSLSSQGSIDMQYLHSTGLCPSGMPSPCSKATTSPQLKASTWRPVGLLPPSTCHRKAPNLHKRHTQTGLDAKELTSE
jgi:hypothetical protein